MYKMIQKSRDKKGFTLVELLVVLAIIAILAAIAVPVYNAQMDKARQGVDEANLRAAESLAVTAYLLNDPENVELVVFHASMVKDAKESEGLEMVTKGAITTPYSGKSEAYKGENIYVKVKSGKVTDSGWGEGN